MTGTLPKFEVSFDRGARRLRWTMRGFWSLADVAAFAAAMRTATAQLGPPPQRYDGLCDSRDFPVQTREVSDALGEIDRIGAAMRRGHFAIVVASTMNKLQVQRTLLSDGIRVFFAMEDAEAWLREISMDQA